MLKPASLLLFLAILLVHGVVLFFLFRTGATAEEGKAIARQIETLHDNIRESQLERDQLREVIANETQRSSAQNNAKATASVKSANQGQLVRERDIAEEAKALGLDWNELNKPENRDFAEETKLPLSKPDPNYHRIPAPRVPQKLLYTGNTVRGAQSYLKGSDVVKSGLLLDLDTMEVFWAKNQTIQCPIASLSKIMTMLLAYEIVMDDASPYTLQSRIPVTKEAINTAPSKVDFSDGESYLLKDLFTAAAVRSANDAAELIADHLGGGNGATFIEDMNRFAKELGLTSTYFTNPHGLPGKTAAEDNKSTAEDIAHLCVEFRKIQYLRELTATRTASFREKTSPKYMQLVNHNNLLPGNKYQYAGVNGIKTGFTNRAGSCVAATCTRDGHNLLAVVLGAPSAQDRDYLAQALFTWGYKRLGVADPVKKSSKAKK